MRWVMLVCANFLLANFIFAVILTKASNDSLSAKIQAITYYRSQKEIEIVFGQPKFKGSDHWRYEHALEEKLTLEWEFGKLSKARMILKKRRPFHELSEIHTIQRMNSEDYVSDSMEWVFVAIPEKGQIFEVNHKGLVRSIDWVRPWKSVALRENIQNIVDKYTPVSKVVLNKKFQ